VIWLVNERVCNFCGENIPPGRGKLFIKNTGKRLFFCSSKCEKNMVELGRKPRDVEWASEEN